MNPAPYYSRYGKLICAVAFCLLPALLYGAIGAFRSNTNNVLDWLPSEFSETQRLFDFVGRFGSDEILIISWEGCTLDDERLDNVAADLVKTITAPTGDEVDVFRRVFTGRETLAELTTEPLKLSSDEAIERMRGWLVGPDGETTCALALITEIGSMHRTESLHFVREVLESNGIAWEDAHLGGPTANAVAIDDASSTRIGEMTLGSCLLGLMVAWLFLKSWRQVAIVMMTAVFAWSSALSLVYISGTNMDAVLLLMPALVFVLAVCGAIHFTNYYVDALEESNAHEQALSTAMRRGWLPCVLAEVTTAFGLGSLLVSELVPVRKFGFFSSVSMGLIIFAVLVLWPAFSSVWPPRTTADRSKAIPSHWWRPLYHIATRYPNAWLILFVLLLPIGGYGISKLRTSAQLGDLISPNSPAIHSYEWLQRHIGSLTPVEVELRFERSSDEDALIILKRAEIVERLRQKIVESSEVDGTISATTFAPSLPKAEGARNLMLRRVIAARLEKHRDRLEELQFLHTSDDTQDWRISTRVNSLNLNYEQFLADLNHLIDSELGKENEAGMKVVSNVCGGVPLIYMAQEQLLKDLIKSFMTAFFLVGLTMVVLNRSIIGGLLSVIPNVFPVLAAFGVMGLMDWPIDIGTVMTASVAMGICDDDTWHFLVWFRRGFLRFGSSPKAVRFAFRHCATAMLQTSIICGVGLLVFIVSPFIPIARFGLVMAIMLALGLIGDLVLLPAALCSSLGSKMGEKLASIGEEEVVTPTAGLSV
ncbi:efflux RND transporter permease subunit [Bythopirellula polymerisocia]|uniref:MMPL family protein n=1 Tax=Bythopirellula polymerisocia TaxID=2528003 RepID=A0A5C6CNM5_9BACT|nr:MMPL family transporter [Bythopirellula polymerisocia]TWU26042.1 MMPL family protein [Bythopirellula polymerisocia]